MYLIFEQNGSANVQVLPDRTLVRVKQPYRESVVEVVPNPDYNPETPNQSPEYVEHLAEIDHPAETAFLGGNDLVNWMIDNGRLGDGSPVANWFIVPDGSSVPSGGVENVDWIAKTWTEPVPVITADMVRAECKRRILQTYPEHVQRNDQQVLTAPSGVGLPSLLTLVETGQANAMQQADYDAIQGRIQRRIDLVWCSNQMEPAPPPDYTDPARWDRTNWDENGNYTSPA